jgi:Peptidase family M3
MKIIARTVATLLFPLSGLVQTGHPAENPKLTLSALQERASRFGTVLTAFDWETTPEQINDAGYYGYAWADAIAADMASVLQKAPDGFLDTTVGHRLRDEIYAVGNSREVSDSVERFLGRKRSIQPFLKNLGIESGTM